MNNVPSRETIHQYLYLFSLALLVCCLPLSKYLLSIAQFLLLLNWLAEGKFREKVRSLRKNPAILVFGSIFLLYLAGMLYTTHADTGWSRVKNVLPLMALPLIIGTTAPLSGRNFRRLLLLFSAAVTVAALVCLISYFTGGITPHQDFRKISLFMLHIRFSLLIVMALLILLYFTYVGDTSPPEKSAFLITALFLAGFLAFLRSFTGIALFMVTFSVFAVIAALQSQKPIIRYGLPSLVAVVALALVVFTCAFYHKNFGGPAETLAETDSLTAGGHPYDRNLAFNTYENGESINRYVCEPELQQAWNRLSTVHYDSADKKGQVIGYTLRRYLTSKGLRKDSAGVSRLTPDDIRAIENGTTNYLFRKSSLHQRYYETLWEIHVWRNTGFVQNHTFGQRIVFVQTASRVIRQHPLAGTGTGDVYAAMLAFARDNHITVQKTWEGKPHNQFAFVLVAFGIAGFIWFMTALLFPACYTKSYRSLLFNLFMMLALLSMLVLDTLESYDSIVFFAFFYSLFSFGNPRIKKT